jgi:hypothetical protein
MKLKLTTITATVIAATTVTGMALANPLPNEPYTPPGMNTKTLSQFNNISLDGDPGEWSNIKIVRNIFDTPPRNPFGERIGFPDLVIDQYGYGGRKPKTPQPRPRGG